MRSPDRRCRLTFLLAMALGLASGVAFSARQPQRLLDRVAARVNNEIITENELLFSAFGDVGKIETLLPGTGPDVRSTLNEMIDERLMAQAARDEIKEIPAEMIANRVEAVVKERRALFPTEQAFLDVLEKRGWDLQSYKNYLREEEERTYAVTAALARRVRIKDEDVAAFTAERQRKGESLTEYRLRQILVALPPQPAAAEVAEAEKRVLALLEQIRQGAPFEQLARDKSNDKSTRAAGGELGWLGDKDMRKAILDAVRNLEKGQVSQPVRTDKGIHLFQMVRTRTAREMLWEQRVEEVRKSWSAELRKRAQIKILLPELK